MGPVPCNIYWPWQILLATGPVQCQYIIITFVLSMSTVIKTQQILQGSTKPKIFTCLTSKILYFSIKIIYDSLENYGKIFTGRTSKISHFQYRLYIPNENFAKINLPNWQFYLPQTIRCVICGSGPLLTPSMQGPQLIYGPEAISQPYTVRSICPYHTAIYLGYLRQV